MIDDIELAVMNCYQDSRISCPACSDSRKKSKEKHSVSQLMGQIKSIIAFIVRLAERLARNLTAHQHLIHWKIFSKHGPKKCHRTPLSNSR